MALAIEIDHARTRAKSAAGSGQPDQASRLTITSVVCCGEGMRSMHQSINSPANVVIRL